MADPGPRTPAGRTRIGLIKESLVQGGSERYAFELCRALDPERFDVDVIGVVGSGLAGQYYGQRLDRLGFRLREELPRIRPFLSLHRFPRARTQLVKLQYLRHRRGVQALLREYDLIAVVQIESLISFEQWLPRDRPIVVHLMSNLLQYDDNPYLRLSPRGRYFVICQHEGQLREAQSMGERIVSARVVQLPIDPAEFTPIRVERTERLQIGIFIRISPERPFAPLLEAFRELVRTTDAVLHHYGSGDPTTLEAELATLGIHDRVIFSGHSAEIRATLVEDGVNFAWMTAFDDELGYAGIEVAALGLPSCFYNQGDGRSPEEILEATGGAVHCFRTPEDLAHGTLSIWRDAERYRDLGIRLRQFVERRHDVRKRITEIEEVYDAALNHRRAWPC